MRMTSASSIQPMPDPYRRDEPLSERNWPTAINGHPARPRRGSCPGCGATEDRWCSVNCHYLDPMDYR